MSCSLLAAVAAAMGEIPGRRRSRAQHYNRPRRRLEASPLWSTGLRPPRCSHATFKQSNPAQYGIGSLRTNQLGRPFVLHDGATGSYSAFNGMFLDDGFSIAILTNIALPNGGSFESTAATFINAVCGASALAGTC